MRNFLNKIATVIALAVGLMGGLSLYSSPSASAAICTSGDNRHICGGGAAICCSAGPTYCNIIDCPSGDNKPKPFTPSPTP